MLGERGSPGDTLTDGTIVSLGVAVERTTFVDVAMEVGRRESEGRLLGGTTDVETLASGREKGIDKERQQGVIEVLGKGREL